MKKLYLQHKWKRHSEYRKRAIEKEQGRRKVHERNRPKREALATQRRQIKRAANARFVTIKAPARLSLVHDPESMLKLIHEMRQIFRSRKNVTLDLGTVESITSDAVTLLLSKITDTRFKSNMICNGMAPANDEAREMLVQCGFFNFVKHGMKLSTERRGQTRWDKERSTMVEAKIASDLIKFATTLLYKESRKEAGVYSTLIECMSNTHNHAGRQSGQETWWATVYCDESRNTAHFSFVDNGVGIFESGVVRGLRRLLYRIGIKDNTELLHAILKGEILSRTGLPYRGQGLPKIYKNFERRFIRNVTIISNNVYANLATNEFRLLDRPLQGTFLYWELIREPQ